MKTAFYNVTACGLVDRVLIPSRGRNILSSHPHWGPYSHLYSGYGWAFPRPDLEADHSLPS